MNILITGSAGFIGFHISKLFLKKGHTVYGIDNLNHYYDVRLKRARNKILLQQKRYKFSKININSTKKVSSLFKKNNFDLVIHLAAQAGVRYSLKNPKVYIDSNIKGFFNIINSLKENNIKNFIYASSSSIYGNSNRSVFKEDEKATSPIQLYAATKRSNELIAHAYSSIYKINTIGLRFFTVYGPWGRPDMVLFKFVKNILNNKSIELFNFGNHYRDFTYIEDAVDILFKLSKIKIKREKKQNFENSSNSKSRFEIFNVSSGKKIYLKKFLGIIEKNLNKKAKIKLLPLQKGDVVQTLSSKRKLKEFINLKPPVSVRIGIKKFIFWFKQYHNLK